MADDYVLKMENISIAFNGIPALRSVDFNLKAGEVHALVGANGAGKSTLMKILTGVYKKDSGTITLNGKQIDMNNPSDAQKHGIAMIYQEFSLVPTMTVAQNVFLKREKRTLFRFLINDKDAISESRKIFKKLNIDIDPRVKVGDLSVGYMQVVEIAKALSVSGTKVLVMDEPTASLSEAETAMLFNFISDLKKSGISIVYISHRMKEIFQICDRITIIKDGKAILSESCSNLTMAQVVESTVGVDAEKAFQWYQRETKPSGEPQLEVKGLQPNLKMKPIDFSVQHGEILGLAGLMGSGRTEIVECLFGISKPIQGEVRMNGKLITSVKGAIKEGMAFLPENRRVEGLVLGHSIRINLMMANLRNYKRTLLMNDKKGKTVTDEYINRLRIKTDSTEKIVGLLSGGNQQKVVFSKWLSRQPSMLILDEPTIGVDIGAKAEIIEIIRTIANQGVSIIVISSELAELLAVSDRLIVLHNGEKIGELSRNDIESEEVLHHAIQGI